MTPCPVEVFKLAPAAGPSLQPHRELSFSVIFQACVEHTFERTLQRFKRNTTTLKKSHQPFLNKCIREGKSNEICSLPQVRAPAGTAGGFAPTKHPALQHKLTNSVSRCLYEDFIYPLSQSITALCALNQPPFTHTTIRSC